jgi:membrane-bound ClpP family serine protease
VRGAVWTARSSEAVEQGDEVEVTAMSGIRLEVRRWETSEDPAVATQDRSRRAQQR